MARKKILITGASGFLGWNICRTLQNQWEVYGLFFSHPIEIPGASMFPCDVTDFAQLKKIFQEIRPDAVIHAAALSQPNVCQMNSTASERINVEAAIHLAGLCADRQIPCAFTSTDLVFDGKHAPYREADPPAPVSRYGEHKVRAEEGMIERYPLTAICRLPLMYGFGGPVAVSFMQPWIRTMREGRELKLFVDEYRTPVSAQTATQGLLLALDKVHGIIHLGGPERISRYDFAIKLRDILNIKQANIIPCLQKDVPMAAPRPPDVSLDSSRAYALGFKPPALFDDLQSLAREGTLG